MKLPEMIAALTDRLGHPLGNEEHLTFGDPSADYRRALVAWKVDDFVIKTARETGCDLILHHESLLHPLPGFFHPAGDNRRWLGWKVNADKLAALGAAGLATFCLHASADKLFIFDAFARKLGLRPIEPELAPGRRYYARLFDSEGTTLGELAARVKAAMGMSWVRCVGDPARKAGAVGLPLGGIGLFVNTVAIQEIVELGAGTLICGETDNHAMCYAAEQGVGVVETSHELSENPGLREFAKFLGGILPIPVGFCEVPCLWQWR